MTDLTILKYRRAEDRLAPEFDYLLSLCAARAGRVFDRVELVVVDEGAAAVAPPAADRVLLLGEDNVLLNHPSLAAMERLLEAGRAVAVPRRLDRTDLPRRHALYTLRGYERAEAEWLAHPPPRSHVGDLGSHPHLPVSLFTAESFARLEDPRGPLPETLRDGLALAGLCHRFSDYYGEPRADILAHIPPGTRSVLEIGCGRGATARLLREKLGCRVVGVELNPEVARAAAEHLDEVLQGDVQDPRIERRLEEAGPFDVVLALELFEHLNHGESFLERARRWVRPGGRVLLSVPNVGHWAVVEDLLAGRWDYLPIGLLCYTHFRFFTRATLEDWLRRCGLTRFEILPQTTELPPRFHELAPGFAIDAESLATSGFYVILTP